MRDADLLSLAWNAGVKQAIRFESGANWHFVFTRAELLRALCRAPLPVSEALKLIAAAAQAEK